MAKTFVGNVKGQKGDKGNGIKEIKQTTVSSLDGGTNIVQVTMDDGTAREFSIKNGNKGSSGNNGTTPHIGENGNWYIGNTDTGVKAQGPEGPVGSVDMTKLRGNDTGFVYPTASGIDANTIDYEFHKFVVDGTNLPMHYEDTIYYERDGNGFLDVEVYKNAQYTTGLLNRKTHIISQTFRYGMDTVTYVRHRIITYKNDGSVADDDWTTWVPVTHKAVDTNPTSLSTNLVTSGGVYSEIKKAKTEGIETELNNVLCNTTNPGPHRIARLGSYTIEDIVNLSIFSPSGYLQCIMSELSAADNTMVSVLFLGATLDLQAMYMRAILGLETVEGVNYLTLTFISATADSILLNSSRVICTKINWVYD